MSDIASIASIVTLTIAVSLSTVAHGASSPSPPQEALEELLVTGERPGPAMWRVSNGTHDLWIFATLSPLPARMTWRSSAVEKRIEQSQVVLSPPTIMQDIGFFGNPIYFQLFERAEHIPNRQELNAVLPGDLFSRWQILRDRYLGSTYDPYLRPIIDASFLFQEVVKESGLITDDAVWVAIRKIARKNHVKVIPASVDIKVDRPEMWIHEFTEVPLDQEINCLSKTIERIETDTEPMRHRANLWSVGDVEALRPMEFPDDRVTCLNVLFSVPRFHVELEEAVAKMSHKWLGLADDSLRDNVSSVAVLPMSEMLKPNGWLDMLRARGYSIFEPR